MQKRKKKRGTFIFIFCEFFGNNILGKVQYSVNPLFTRFGRPMKNVMTLIKNVRM